MKFSEMSKEMLEGLMKGNVISNVKGGGRKEEVLNMLKEGVYSIKELGVEIGISSRNVSSIVSYLRDDGIEFREINKGGNKGLVLWGIIRNGEKVGNRIVKGKEGFLVRFDFEKGCFEDEVVEDVVEDEVEEEKEV